jgi:spore coat protein U-like protein
MKTASFFLLPGAVLALTCLGAGGSAQAGALAVQQTVRAVVSTNCTADVGTALAFNTLTTTAVLAVSQTDAVGTITINCVNGTAYSVIAGNGNNYSGGWRMVNGSGKYLTYGLYSNAARTTTFPSSGTTVAATGNGSAQTLTVYGRVPAQTVGGTGDFTDAVAFTVTY